MTASSMTDALYHEGYFERAEGSNYRSYGDDPGWGPTARIVAEHMGEGASLLEIGCAKGYFVKAAHDHGLVTYGSDISKYAVSQASEEVKHFVSVGNATSIQWGPASFYGVCSWEVLEHVPMDEIDKVVQEMLRVLKPGGMMWHRIGLEGAEHDDDVTHVLLMPEAWWRGLFESYGLERCRDEEVQLSAQFSNRDWKDRFFVYRKAS